jgi:hypothetical protein
MKYIRTKDGRIVDIEKFINEEKDTPYYKDFIFEEITKDGELKWTAIGTEKCSIKDQIGRRCHFSATLNSEVIKQADTIEELCDEFCLEQPLQDIEHIWFLNSAENHKEFIQRYNQSKWCEKLTSGWQKEAINGYGAIYTDKGLIYVAKINEKREWELL